jgi:Flp pilus assembly protein TadG
MKLFKTMLRKFHLHQSGVAAIEFAIVLPVLILLVLGGYEGWRMIFAGQRTDMVAYTVSDLASRLTNGTNEDDLTSMLAGGAMVAEPYDIGKDGRVILSAVDPSAGRKILWQRCWGKQALDSSLGIEGATADLSAIARMPTSTDSVFYITEAKLTYTPPFAGFLYDPIVLTRTAIVPGRLSNPTAIDPKGIASNC